MDIFEQFGPLGLAQEADHRDDDQQRLQPFAQQDGERAKEGRRIAACLRREAQSRHG